MAEAKDGHFIFKSIPKNGTPRKTFSVLEPLHHLNNDFFFKLPASTKFLIYFLTEKYFSE